MRTVLAAVLFAGIGNIASAQSHVPMPDPGTELEAALARVAPSLVRIHVVSVDFQDGRELKREASGSGTIISPDGMVITNHHVAGRTRAITAHRGSAAGGRIAWVVTHLASLPQCINLTFDNLIRYYDTTVGYITVA